MAVSWDEALDLIAGELARVRERYGNPAIFGGSYGWASAGRLHHARTRLHRFLWALGGAPLEHRSLSIKPPPEVRFFGVVAAYRDIRNAQWRAELGVPDKSKTIVINVAHTSVSLSMY